MPEQLKQLGQAHYSVKRKILLTGGNGLVGRNIQEHPSASTWNIIAPTKNELNLMDGAAVSNWIEKYQPDMIIHAAGLVGGIKANIDNPVNFLDINMIIGRNVMIAARDYGVRHVINLGSSCMYPHSVTGLLSEDLLMTGQLEPTNEGYALAKLATAKLCQYIRQENPKMIYKTLIPCNIYGKYDNFDPKSSHLVPAIIKKIHTAKANNLNFIDVWGDGEARREYLYAGDLADAILLAAENLESIPDLMNVGFGKDYSINEYYKTAASVLNGGQFEV